MGEQSALVHFRCDAPAHRRTVEGRLADTLTIHEGRWAYCPYDVNAREHRWHSTGGVAIELLRHGTPRVSLSLDARPQPSHTEIEGPVPPTIRRSTTPRRGAARQKKDS